MRQAFMNCSAVGYLLAWAGCLGLLTHWKTFAAEPVAAKGFQFKPVNDQSLGLWEGDRPVLVYNHGMVANPVAARSRPRACYIHPVYGMNGEVLTDDFPKDHTYHRGVFWAWSHIKLGDREYDLWSNNGEMRQVFQRWLAKESQLDGARLGVENGWMVDDKMLVREQLWLDVHSATDNGRAIDVHLTWTPIDQPLTLSGAAGKSYGGFNFRFAPRKTTVITIPESSRLPDGVTAADGRTSADLLITKLPWVDFSGDFGGTSNLSGAAVFVHPQHRDFPPTWMTRHYGLISVGWPGVDPQTFPANQPIECRYRIWIHGGNPSAKEIDQLYQLYCGEKK